MNRRYILIVLSLICAFGETLYRYTHTMEYNPDIDIYDYQFSFVQSFSMFQLFFIIAGHFFHWVFFPKERGQAYHLIYPIEKRLVTVNVVLSFILALVIIFIDTGSTGYSDMPWREYFGSLRPWFLAYIWFSTPYIILFYSEIVLISVFRILKKRVSPPRPLL